MQGNLLKRVQHSAFLAAVSPVGLFVQSYNATLKVACASRINACPWRK